PACSWTADAGPSWAHCTSGCSSNGAGTAGYTVEPNTSIYARTVNLTIAGQTVAITESGVQIVGSGIFSVTPSAAVIAAGGGGGTIAARACDECPWQAPATVDWLTRAA